MADAVLAAEEKEVVATVGDGYLPAPLLNVAVFPPACCVVFLSVFDGLGVAPPSVERAVLARSKTLLPASFLAPLLAEEEMDE